MIPIRKLKPSTSDREERMNFIEYWANYVGTQPDKEWSRQQNIIVNSQVKNAKFFQLSAKEYLKIKEEKCNR
jgi:hypothetical protein